MWESQEVEELKQALEREIEISNKRMNEKYGADFMEEFHRRMDEAMTEAMAKQFENFAPSTQEVRGRV